MRSSFNVHILEMYIIYVTYNVYIYIYLCIAYISSHSKGPEQDQLRSPFVPYVRNTAERSIHNFDSGPYIYVCDIIVSQYIVYDKIVFHSHPSVALRLEQLRTRRFAWRLGHSDSTCDDFAVAVLRALGNIWKQGHLRFRWKFPKNCMSFADQTAWACENTDMVCASRSWLHRSKVTSLTASHADWRKPPEALGNHRKSFAPVSEASCRWAPSTLFLLRVI